MKLIILIVALVSALGAWFIVYDATDGDTAGAWICAVITFCGVWLMYLLRS